MRFQPKRILCATDLTPYSNHALRYGVALARKFKAKLLVGHTVDVVPLSVGEPSAGFLLAKWDEARVVAEDKICRLMEGESVPWESAIRNGAATVEIPQAAEDLRADLVVAASHARSGLKRFLLGSVTESLVYGLHCPFLVVRQPEREFVEDRAAEIALRKILVGIDFSPDSDLALEHAISLAQEFQSEIHLMHVIEPAHYKHWNGSTGVLAREIERSVADTVDRELAKLVPAGDYPWCDVRRVRLPGRPDEEIIRHAAEEKVDLIVLGVRGRHLLGRLFVGSTTDRVLRQAPCPVLTVVARAQSPGSPPRNMPTA
jgi:nucleotide-binding universal stress UspA family protein